MAILLFITYHVFFFYGYGGFNKLANTKKVVYLVKGGKRPHMGIDY